jgi:formiminotetrahydrofolate cyclodeaminase
MTPSDEPATSYLDEDLGTFLGLVADRAPAPGGGAVAAVSLSLAAALVTMAARFTEPAGEPDPPVAVQAERLRLRAAALADIDAAAYGSVIAAYARSPAVDDESRRDRIRRALQGATEIPLEMTEIGAQIAGLAAALVEHGNPNLRGDAHTALLLAQSSVRSAAALVGINVEAGRLDDDLVRRAERNVTAAAEAVASAPA